MSFADSYKKLVTKSSSEYDTFFRALGIEAAGPVPNSLLARQDLETSKSSVCVYWCAGPTNEQLREFGNETDANAFATLMRGMYTGVRVEKGAVEQTGKQLNRAVKAAEDAETDKEKNALVQRIKQIQQQRQAATIVEREKQMQGMTVKDVLAGKNLPNSI